VTSLRVEAVGMFDQSQREDFSPSQVRFDDLAVSIISDMGAER
jgi:hypothetical protein